MICIDYTLWVEFIAKKPAVATTLTGVTLRNRLSIVVCQHVLLKHVIVTYHYDMSSLRQKEGLTSSLFVQTHCVYWSLVGESRLVCLKPPEYRSYLVDPASSHMLVSKIKPCKSKYMHSFATTVDGSLKQL